MLICSHSCFPVNEKSDSISNRISIIEELSLLNLLSKANNYSKKNLKIFQKFGYVSLAIDADTIGLVNYFDILLTNALISQTPLIYKAYQHFKGNMKSYQGRRLLKEVVSPF